MVIMVIIVIIVVIIVKLDIIGIMIKKHKCQNNNYNKDKCNNESEFTQFGDDYKAKSESKSNNKLKFIGVSGDVCTATPGIN